SPAHLTLRSLLREQADIAVTEIVIMELLAGARSDEHAVQLRSTLLGFPVLPLRGLADYEAAAQLYRCCRLAGRMVRKMTDCLIAVSAISAGATLLHRDADFDTLATHTPLQIHPLLETS
ncbi:MAG: type II toxin-antitoxin system VapC family toxin, partial [Pseudonocardiaceae bacterium]